MLRITQQSSADAAKQYYTSAGADYYAEGQEIVGRWGGEAARLLGLEGTVSKREFNALCENRHPRGGGQLTARTRGDRTVGYDFTWSVPKSLSVLYAMTEDKALLDAFREAVHETMGQLETEMKVRVRSQARNEERTTGNLAYAEFVHFTSRPVDNVPDPQMHAHCFVFNASWDKSEQKWKAGQFRDLKRDAPYFQAVMRVRLANKLQDLGYGVERKRDDFEISNVPRSAIRRFSRRTEEIEKIAAERGITDPDRKAELGALTREKKNSRLNWDELRQEWDSRLTEQERQAIAAVHRREIPYARETGGERAAVDYALSHCFTREAVVPERKLLTEALKRGIGTVSLDEVQQELARRPMIRLEQDGRVLTTSLEMRSAEARLLAFARKGRGRFRPFCDPKRQFVRTWLNDGQQAAVRHALGSRDAVTIIRGPAGTGKTSLEAELREALADAGVPVVAMAQSTEARDVLREQAGFGDAVTVARFLADTATQQAARGGVMLVDEASLLGTRDMGRLFDIARAGGSRIILVGDKRQHRSVSAGEPLRLLEERAGLPVAEVTEIMRQEGDYRKAARALSEGRTAEGFAELDRLGWVKEVPDSERYQALADAYLAATSEQKKGGHKTALVVSPTHAEGNRITGAIRAVLKEQGKLGEEHVLATWVPAQLTDAEKADPTAYEPGQMLKFHQNAPGHKNGSRLVVAAGQELPLRSADRFEVFRPAKLALAVGDRVRATANGKTKDGKHSLTNGALFTVAGFTKQGDPIVDRGWVIAKDWGHLAHGYCVTSHASQGKTIDKVFVGLSSQSFPAATQRSFYVPVTRGREQALVFTDSKDELLHAVQRPDEPMSATELAHLARRRRQTPFLQRLRKHLAFVRRRENVERAHPLPAPMPHKVPDLYKEYAYAR